MKLAALAAMAALLAVHADATPAVSPRPGLWALSSVMDGTPSGKLTMTTTACLDASRLAGGFEQAVLDALSAQGGPPKGPPRCTVKMLQHDGAESTWSSQCDGPRGPMTGSGSASLGEDQASLRQQFELRTPFGLLHLQETVQAQRQGDCP